MLTCPLPPSALKGLDFFIFQTYHVNIPVCFLSRLGVHLPPRGHFSRFDSEVPHFTLFSRYFPLWWKPGGNLRAAKYTVKPY